MFTRRVGEGSSPTHGVEWRRLGSRLQNGYAVLGSIQKFKV